MNVLRSDHSSLGMTTSNVFGDERVQELNPTSSSSSSTASVTGSTKFSLQKLSLDSAVSPLLSRPTAPFDRTERKRAHTSAVYYSECFLRGIEPVVADTAAEDAQGQYDKWWVNATLHDEGKDKTSTAAMTTTVLGTTLNTTITDSDIDNNRVTKKQKTTHDDNASIQSSAVVSTVTSSGEPSNLTSEDESTMVREDQSHPPMEMPILFSTISTVACTKSQLREVKMRLITDLRASGGSTQTDTFQECLEFLEAYYKSKSWDGRGSHDSFAPFKLEGQWLTLSKPTYNECKGRNEKGEYLYSLGRLSFDMFKPTNLVCSIQAVFNSVRPMDPRKPDRPLHVPRSLMKEIQKGQIHLQTYE